MISKYLREQRRYTQKELSSILECSDEEIVPLLRKLKEYGLLKAVKASDIQKDMSDLLDEDIEISDVEIGENEYLYVFSFVGIIVIAGRVLKCYPKYLLSDDQPKEEFLQVVKVLEKYNTEEQIVRMFNDSSDSTSFNLLAVLLYLLQDYFENGSYNNPKEIVEDNGTGEIIWDKTINETYTMILNNRPYYIDLQTKKRINNEHDYFKRLHECILTKASKELGNADLLELFELTGVELSDETIEDFGEKEYILYRIENELTTQFNTRKQRVLKTMYAYIAHDGTLADLECMSLFGTNNFNLVWEKVCADIMDNQLHTKLKKLRLPNALKEEYNPEDTLIDLIEKPYWTETKMTANDTLTPDLISITDEGGDWQFIIFDAKYYNAKLKNGEIPQGQPGVESVTKQYLYQLAYKQFIEDQSFKLVKNCFLLPVEDAFLLNKDDCILDKGKVYMQMLRDIGLQDIEVRFLSAKIAFEYYLTGNKMEISKLKL